MMGGGTTGPAPRTGAGAAAEVMAEAAALAAAAGDPPLVRAPCV